MRYHEIILEYVKVPHAYEIYDLIEKAIADSKNENQLRTLLQNRLQEFIDSKHSFKKYPLKVLISDVDAPNTGGFFRSPDDDGGYEHNPIVDLVPPIVQGTAEIYIFLPDWRLNIMMERYYKQEEMIRSVGQMFIHELVHAIQNDKADKYRPLIKFTYGANRSKEDGKRYGKRTGYDPADKQRYYSSDIELDAHASSAASEIIHRVRKEKPEDRKAYLNNVIRTLRDSSGTLSTYRDLFHMPMFLTKENPQSKVQRAKMWKEFKTKLARHLMDYIGITESAEPRTVLILVSPNGKSEKFNMNFREFIQQRNIPNISPLLDAGNVWCNVGLTDSSPFISVYWKTVKPRQIQSLQIELKSLGLDDNTRCEVYADGKRIPTTIGKIAPPPRERIRRPSKQLQAAESMNVVVLDDDLEGNTLTRVVWGEKTSTIEVHDPSLVSLADKSNEYPGIYALHVGDTDFWFHKLIDDYGNDTTAYEIDIYPARGDVLVEDVQYAMPEENGLKAYSAILLTTRKILREGKDFKYVKVLTDER